MRRMAKWYLLLFVLVMIGCLAAWLLISTQRNRPDNAQLVSVEPAMGFCSEETVRMQPEELGKSEEATDLLICEGIGGAAR